MNIAELLAVGHYIVVVALGTQLCHTLLFLGYGLGQGIGLGGGAVGSYPHAHVTV